MVTQTCSICKYVPALASLRRHYTNIFGKGVVANYSAAQIPLDTIASSGYAFLIELKYRLIKAGAPFKEIPIIFQNRASGESKISNHIIREGVLAPWKLILRR